MDDVCCAKSMSRKFAVLWILPGLLVFGQTGLAKVPMQGDGSDACGWMVGGLNSCEFSYGKGPSVNG